MNDSAGQKSGLVRLLAAGARIGFIVASMVALAPAVIFAQTTESASEHTPATTVDATPPSDPVTPTASDIDIQSRFNELRRELLDDRADTIDWWLNANAIIITFFAIVVAIAGFLGIRWCREIMKEAQESANAASRHAEEASLHIKEIQKNRDISRELLEGTNAQTVADNPKEVNEAVENVQNSPGASLTDRAIAAAVEFQQQGAIEKAIAKWQAIANITEGNDNNLAATAWFSVGYLIRDESLEKNISAYDQAIHLNPGFVAAYNNRGIAKAESNEHKAAIADFDHAIGLNPNYDLAYVNRGVAKAGLDMHEAAIADFDQAIRLNRNHGGAYFARGNSKAKLNEYEAAIADFDQAIRLNPDGAEAYSNRGAAKSHLKQNEAAIADFDQAIRLNPDSAEAYSNRGAAKAELKEYEAAIADFDQAIRLNPGGAEVYSNRAIAKAQLGRKSDAQKDLEAARQLVDDDNQASRVEKIQELLRQLDNSRN